VQSLRRSFDADPACVPEVRRFIREALEAWNAGEAEWSACQLGSELATNAILHATTRFEIELTLGSGAGYPRD
jgi:anti-sigma regulatory factor (Ser/Thr protein kinase)